MYARIVEDLPVMYIITSSKTILEILLITDIW